MIQKFFLQGAVLIAVFAGVFFGLSRLDYLHWFNLEQHLSTTEEKLGDLLWESIEATERVESDPKVNDAIDKIVKRIADANDIDFKTLKIHVVQKDEVNAFAMPNRHLVVYTGLIAAADHESEIAGVIAHELGHIQRQHVMKKLIKEAGLSVLISMTTGGRSPQVIQQAAKLLSSSAYDRELESEADRTGAGYMIKADLDPNVLADFLYKMTTPDLPDEIYWVSTHPESKSRAEAIVRYVKGKKFTARPILTEAEWNAIHPKK